ncbi:MAG: N-acetylglucosamine-6-phosphate deacetylase [Proteobacteria bacterium]|nr:N-acetylglucosamine-6-phosphate deacetylase [Pseudomonadota bacterium]
MALRAFIADAIVVAGGPREGALLTENGRVTAVAPVSEVPSYAEKIRLPSLTLAPGLVDLQVNGGGGALFNQDTSPEGLRIIRDAHRAMGTTALLPTLISEGTEKIPEAFQAVRAWHEKEKDTGILGIHLEGPFLNPERKGVHEAEALRLDPSETLRELDFSGFGKILITLAPELVDERELKKLSSHGVILSAGHSQADQAALNKAKAAGLRGITHLFNAMGPLQAREPGLAGLALNDDDLWCSIICDGAHVWHAMIRLALKAKPEGKLFFVSDAMPPAGQKDPQPFTLYGKKITVKNGRCLTEAGGLAGSALTLFECVQKAVREVGIPLPQALAMASFYPAQFLGVEKEYGSFAPGSHADIIALDKDLNLKGVWVGGMNLETKIVL